MKTLLIALLTGLVSVGSVAGQTGDGLTGHYFSTTTLTGPSVDRIDKVIDFAWGGAPIGTVPPDNFSVRWDGQLDIQAPGAYTFRTVADDGVRLRVDGQLILDDWNVHPATEKTSAAVSLMAGRHGVALDFFDASGGAVVRLQWATPGNPLFVTIPTTRMFSVAGQPVDPVPTEPVCEAAKIATPTTCRLMWDLDPASPGDPTVRFDVLVDGVKMDQVMVSPPATTGTFQAAFPVLAPGTHTVTVQSFDADGESRVSDPFVVTVLPPEQPPPQRLPPKPISLRVVKPGPS